VGNFSRALHQSNEAFLKKLAFFRILKGTMMNKTRAVSSLFWMVISLLATATHAEELKEPLKKPDVIKTVDKNNDGKASKAEFFAAMEKKFHSMDVDKSERVSVQEFKLYGEKDPEARKKAQQALIPPVAKTKVIPDRLTEEAFTKGFVDRAEQEFAALDKNHDQTLTASELGVSESPKKKNAKSKPVIEKKIPKEDFIALFTESAERNFAELDNNYDGELTHDELGLPNAIATPAVKPKVEPTPESVKTPAPAKPEPKVDVKQIKRQKLINSFFVGIDANKDGQISNQEKNAAFDKLFNHLDTNHDQFITFDEIIAGRHAPVLNNP
jgi:Ca2+-binding EF-hand superfamily protein